METVKYALPMSLQPLQLGAANATRPSEIPARKTTLPDIAFHLLLLLCAVAFFAGLVDSIAGGGGLITVPVMLIAGIPPLQTLGTNKVQSLFGAASAMIAYTRAMCSLRNNCRGADGCHGRFDHLHYLWRN